MTPISKYDADGRESRRQAAYRRLGTPDARCAVCAEDDPEVLELHHLAGVAYDDQLVILCGNCHKKQRDPRNNQVSPAEPPLLERWAHYLLGLIALVEIILARLRAFAGQMLEASAVCPWPYGLVGAPAAA